MSETPPPERNWAAIESTIRRFYEDRWYAHEVIFRHRHPLPSAEAHRELVKAIYSPAPRVSVEGFRGLAKSTYLEEAALLKAGFGEFRHLVILGASEQRACERLASIKGEFVNNDIVQFLFKPNWTVGDGRVWQETRVIFDCGGKRVCIQAIGRDQKMTGIKWGDIRPDAFICDDVEDPEERRSDAERAATWGWLLRSFLPALDDPLLTWGRFLGTRRGVGSLPERLEKSGVVTVKIPIEHPDPESGDRVPTWPAKFPLPKIDELRRLYRGDMHTYAEEYMCQPMSTTDRDFGPEMIVLKPRERVWEAIYAFIDPASSVHRTSATTGWAVWSWIGSRLVVWDGGAERIQPDKVVELAYQIIDKWNPVWLGVERTGLYQFLMQPLRQEQVRRGMAIAAIKPVDAGTAIRSVVGQGKIAFIRALQPFFAAREVEFATMLPALTEQLLSFPHPPFDAPNALAYALTMRPGGLIYDGFGPEHIAEGAAYDPLKTLWLAANATAGMVTVAALQHGMGVTRILADWALEGSPSEVVPMIAREAALQFRGRLPIKVCAGPTHFDRWQNVGLAQAFKAVPMEVEAGTTPLRGRDWLRGEFGKLIRAEPAVRVSRETRLTLNALAGGYSRPLGKSGIMAEDAEPGMYRLLMEGIESCLGRMSLGADDVDESANWAYSATGQRYRKYGRA